ncbi:lysoplasmalogenase family protein [Variovorax sp. OV329]|uniref:lysoplasmalogenase family protein n=1 Tax=Variovorax sp. OV329 TaxID=1882825 RepID=UPI0008E71130|nr:lysoplasmalogenase family protein [Variovorax sp. OV329]SFM72945.1 Sterol desaturase/sphingolipid hydroxylase, fatty acid hydroxylase superfamily [Variovorax sp. OV329]
MRPGQVIVLATPIFLISIGIEFLIGRIRARRGTGQDTYRLADTVNSIGLGMLSQIGGVLSSLLRIAIYTACWSAFALFPASDFWMQWYGWLLALVFYDLCYYWQHRMSHECAVLWAAHVVHHQSQHYNLSTALRQTSSGFLLDWIFYIPMALAGVPPLVFGVVALIDLLYQFWVHTEQVGKLGWFDRWFCSPSNHRVHHAVNDRYVDRNYGGVLIVWDRLFGSFKEEDERPVYGTRKPLDSWDPLWANLEVYWALGRDAWRTKHWGDKLRIWFKPPGWRPADLAASDPHPPFDIAQVRRYEPVVPGAVQLFAGLLFLVLLGGTVAFLWFAEVLPMPTTLVWLAVLSVGLWSTGALLQGRLSVLDVVFVNAAALATASGALGIAPLHLVTKPLALAVGIAIAWRRSRTPQAGGRFGVLLLAGLAGSLAGDVFLMLGAHLFVPGLASFLVAHLFYIALFTQGVGLFPRRWALAATLGVGGAMYAFLWAGGLPAGLRVPVALYVVVIACMAAQAIGRAAVLKDGAARAVALGALFFMLSDSLLALNRFVSPLPLASLWVLSTYYAAQWLILRHSVRPQPGAAREEEAQAPNRSLLSR